MKVGSLGEGRGLCPSYHILSWYLWHLDQQGKGATDTDRLDEALSEETFCKVHTAMLD